MVQVRDEHARVGRRRIDLTENGPPETVALDDAVGLAVAGSAFVDARHLPGTRLWELRPLSKVGAVAVGGVEVHVAPKVPIDRVVFLLEYSLGSVGWQVPPVHVDVAPDLLLAVVEVFERAASRALQQGVLQGYRTVEETATVVRGRVLHAEQLRHRFGLPLPVDVRFDDFSVDTPENRLLRAAAGIARRLPGVSGALRHRLLRLDAQLDGVTRVAPRSVLEPWYPTRLNSRLFPALRLAEVIWRSSSFEAGDDDLAVSGFVIDMAKVFEDFVCTALGRALVGRAGGSVKTQDPWALDAAGAVGMKPDLVWYAPSDHVSGAGHGRLPLQLVQRQPGVERLQACGSGAGRQAAIGLALQRQRQLGQPQQRLKGRGAGAAAAVAAAAVAAAAVVDAAVPGRQGGGQRAQQRHIAQAALPVQRRFGCGRPAAATCRQAPLQHRPRLQPTRRAGRAGRAVRGRGRAGGHLAVEFQPVLGRVAAAAQRQPGVQ